jgi:type IV pilus assembly protein PilW
MVALAVASVVLAIIYTVYTVQQRSFRRETMIVDAQQNLRSALILVERELRVAGYDRNNTDLFGITAIGLDGDNNGTITFTADIGDAGNADNGVLDTNETFTYAIYDAPTTTAVGNLDLGRTRGTGATELVAEGVEALGFAFAFDADADGRLDFNDPNADGVMTPPAENIYWAVDSDGDNVLDLELDTNKDGEITLADGTAPLPVTVNMDRIRAVKIFLLVRTKSTDFGYHDPRTYVVGLRQITPAAGDHFRRRLLVSTVKLRNMGL